MSLHATARVTMRVIPVGLSLRGLSEHCWCRGSSCLQRELSNISLMTNSRAAGVVHCYASRHNTHVCNLLVSMLVTPDCCQLRSMVFWVKCLMVTCFVTHCSKTTSNGVVSTCEPGFCWESGPPCLQGVCHGMATGGSLRSQHMVITCDRQHFSTSTQQPGYQQC